MITASITERTSSPVHRGQSDRAEGAARGRPPSGCPDIVWTEADTCHPQTDASYPSSQCMAQAAPSEESPTRKGSCLIGGLSFWFAPGPLRPQSGRDGEVQAHTHLFKRLSVLWMAGIACGVLWHTGGGASRCPEAALLEQPEMGHSGIAATSSDSSHGLSSSLPFFKKSPQQQPPDIGCK